MIIRLCINNKTSGVSYVTVSLRVSAGYYKVMFFIIVLMQHIHGEFFKCYCSATKPLFLQFHYSLYYCLENK